MSIEGTAQTEYASLSGKIHTFVVDKTLTISGACADAKVVGDRMEPLEACVEEAKELYEEAVAGINDTAAQIAEEKSREAVNKLNAGDVGAFSKVENLDEIVKNTLGLDASAVPNDAFSLMSRFHTDLGNEHIWKRTETLSAEVPAGYTLGEVQSNVVIFGHANNEYDIGWKFSDDVTVDNNGRVTLATNNKTGTEIEYADGLAGTNTYYIFNLNSLLNPDAIYYIPAGATIKCGYNNTAKRYEVTASQIQLVTGYPKKEAGTHIDYVNSPNADAYSATDSEGRTYEYMGKLGGAAHIVTGTYTGNNAASRTISLGTTPKAVLLIGRNGAMRDGNYIYGGLVLPNSSVINMNGGQLVGPTAIEITTGGFNVCCNEGNQFKASTNSKMLQYHYIAII